MAWYDAQMENHILTWSRTQTIRVRNQLARWVGGCVYCGGSGAACAFSPRLCAPCADKLTGLNVHRCGQCAVMLMTDDALCLSCMQSPPALRYVFAFADYHSVMQHLILNYKFHNMLHAAPVLADMLHAALTLYAQHLSPDVIVPVPQFDGLTHMRGFVPLLHIVRQVDVQRLWLNPPQIQANAVIRLHHAHLQVSSAPEQRRQQIKNAFAAACDFTGQQVLLIDDVYTTGATLNELARVCLEAGAKSVDALVLARGRKVK